MLRGRAAPKCLLISLKELNGSNFHPGNRSSVSQQWMLSAPPPARLRPTRFHFHSCKMKLPRWMRISQIILHFPHVSHHSIVLWPLGGRMFLPWTNLSPHHPEETHKAEARVDFYTNSSDRKSRRLLACARVETTRRRGQSVCVRACVRARAGGRNTITPSGTSALQSANPPSSPLTPLLASISLSILPHPPLSKSTGDIGSF